MCLQSTISTSNNNADVVYGYQIKIKCSNGKYRAPFWPDKRPLKFKNFQIAKNNELIKCDETSTKYRSGFHIIETRHAAIKFYEDLKQANPSRREYVICEVIGRNVTARGFNYCHDDFFIKCSVCRELRVISEISTQV